ncbi:MAG: hypothetical protein R3A43_02015 [Bacteroidia bacterium]
MHCIYTISKYGIDDIVTYVNHNTKCTNGVIINYWHHEENTGDGMGGMNRYFMYKLIYSFDSDNHTIVDSCFIKYLPDSRSCIKVKYTTINGKTFSLVENGYSNPNHEQPYIQCVLLIIALGYLTIRIYIPPAQHRRLQKGS